MDKPAVVWPNDAHAAAMITVNFDADLFWLRLDPGSVNRVKTRSIGEYGALRGAPRLLDALRNAEVRSTWFICTDLLERYGQLVERVANEGHCIADRGRGLDDFASLGHADQLQVISLSRSGLEMVTGRPPKGFRSPGDVTEQTIDVLLGLGYEWSSITRGDDWPIYLAGTATGSKALVDVPRSWDLDDTSRFLFNYGPPFPKGQGRISAYEAVLGDWTAEFDAIYENRGCYVLTLDPQGIGTPGRISLLERLLQHIKAHDDVWLATGDEMNHWWRNTAPSECWTPEVIRRREQHRLYHDEHLASHNRPGSVTTATGEKR